MLCLVYLSRPLIDFSQNDIDSLFMFAQTNNQNLNITGYLYFNGINFIQYLEGNEKDVLALYEKIRFDKRHQVTHTCYSQKYTQRRFPDWSMEHIQKFDLGDILLEDMAEIQLKEMGQHSSNHGEDNLALWQTFDQISQAVNNST